MPGSFSSQRKSRICPIDPKSGPRTIAWCATGAGNCQKTLDDLGKVKMKMKKENHDSDSKGKQANPPAESPHRELVTLWSSKETAHAPAPPGRSSRECRPISGFCACAKCANPYLLDEPRKSFAHFSMKVTTKRPRAQPNKSMRHPGIEPSFATGVLLLVRMVRIG